MLKKLPVLLITGLLTFGALELHAAKALMGLRPGDPAPDFQIRTIGGRQITNSTLRGKIGILAFWRRGQDYSEKALTDLERIYREYHHRGVIVLAINADGASGSEVREARAALSLSYPMGIDRALEIYGRFGVIVLPTTLVIGPGGKLADYRTIYMKDFYSQVRGRVRILLGEITGAQLERELNPAKLQEQSEGRKRAFRYLNLGRALMEIRLKDKARIALEKAVEEDPSLLEPHVLLARLYLQNEEIRKARVHMEYAFKGNPGPKEAKLLQGIAYAQHGDDQMAISVLNGLVRNNPTPPPEAYFHIGRIYEKQNKMAQALEAYRMALKLIIVK